MGGCNTIVSVYMLYRHLQQYCSHPLICKIHLYFTNMDICHPFTLKSIYYIYLYIKWQKKTHRNLNSIKYTVHLKQCLKLL